MGTDADLSTEEQLIKNIIAQIKSSNIPNSLPNKDSLFAAIQRALEPENELLNTLESHRLAELKTIPFLVENGYVSLTAAFRPYSKQIRGLFSNKEVISLLEHGPKFRNFGWDLSTTDNATPVEGEYFEVKDGNIKSLRIYRDGQIIAVGSTSKEFLSWGTESMSSEYKKNTINALAICEYMTSFMNFVEMFWVTGGLNTCKSVIIHSEVMLPSGENVLFFPKHMFDQIRGNYRGGAKSYEIEIKLDAESINPSRVSYEFMEWFYQLFGLREEKFAYLNLHTKEVDVSSFKDK